MCHFWNDVALSQGRLRLRIRTKYGQFPAFCSEMNPNLGRSITLWSYPGGCYPAERLDFENLSHLRNKCEDLIHEMHISLTEQSLLELCQLLENPANFRNLKYLHLIISDKGFASRGTMNLQILPRIKLTSIKVHTMIENKTQDNLQNLLNSALNLERLKLQGNWLPNMAMTRNLTFFKFLGRADFSLTELSEILKHVANSIKILQIGNIFSWNRANDGSRLQLPVMQNLRKFINLNSYVFPCQMVNFSAQRMPQLRSLELRHPIEKGLGDMIRRGGDTLINSGVTSVTLHPPISLDVAANLRSQFPNHTNHCYLEVL